MKYFMRPWRMNGIYRRTLANALAAASLLLFAVTSIFADPGSSPGQVRGKWTMGFTLGGGFPLGEFMTNIGHPGGGLDISLGRRFGDSPVVVGLDVCWIMYGFRSHREFLSSTIPLEVEVETTNNILLGLLYVKFQPGRGRVRPYAEALGGFSYLFTDTSIYDNGGSSDDPIASDINFDDTTLTAGAGAGLEIRLGRGRSGGYGPRSTEWLLDLKVRYLFGGTAKYLREDSIVQENGQYTYLYNQSRTNLISAQVGIAVNF
jgi:hypothetical protein